MSSFMTNRLRSSLTALGIVVGVTAVIVLIGLGDGVEDGFMSSLGTQGTFITVSGNSVAGAGSPQPLDDRAVASLRDPRRASDIAMVTPVMQGNAVVAYGQNQYSGTVIGSNTGYLATNMRELALGSMFTMEQFRNREKVVVLGPELVKYLYGGNSVAALGSHIRIAHGIFKVLGVLEPDGADDNIALMPLDVARSYVLGGGDDVSQIVVQAESPEQVPAAMNEVDSIVDALHGIHSPAKRDFSATNLQSELEQTGNFLNLLKLFTVAVASLSLFVGAIGVANIMLVTVTERTREIGICKAIGARRSAILKQFLIECIILSGTGGIAGVVLGIAAIMAAKWWLTSLVPGLGNPQVSPLACLIALGVSLLIGIVAGCYPAYRASKLRPIDALRH